MNLSRREMLRRTCGSAACIGLGCLSKIPAVAAEPGLDRHEPPPVNVPAEPATRQRLDELHLPDADIVSAYERAATQNVLAAVDPTVFFGYWSVCADREGFGRGNTYPSLDGHQLSDALLWLDELDVVAANWDYVRSFQKPSGRLPLAILPEAHKVYGQPV